MAVLKRSATAQSIKAGVDRYVFPDGRGVIVLGDGRISLTPPSLVASMNLTIHALALTEVAVKRQALGVRVHDIKKEFDEQTAALHCAALGLEITSLTAEQAEYIGVPPTGPFKPEHYRY
jgi:adenosylhomocysteinase